MTKLRKPRGGVRRRQEPPPEAPAPSTIQGQIAWIALNSGLSVARIAEEHAERAAIREYLGGMPRAEAEAAAIFDTCDAINRPELQAGLRGDL